MRKRLSATVLIACIVLVSPIRRSVAQVKSGPSKGAVQVKKPPVSVDLPPIKSQDLWVNIFPVAMQIFGLHRDVRDPNTTYARTHRGLYKSSNGGLYWEPVFVRGTQFLTFAQSPNSPDVMYLGTSDTDIWANEIFVPVPSSGGRSMENGSLWRSNNGGRSWQDINADNLIKGGISQLAVDPRDPNVLYVVSSSLFKTSNGGRTWADIGGGSGFLCVNPWQPDNLILPGYKSLRESTDGGVTWNEKQLDAQFGPQITPRPNDVLWWTFFMFHPANKRIRLGLVGSSEDLVISEDDGSSWTDISIAAVEGRQKINSLEFSTQSDQVIYAGTNSGLYVSKNRGRTWQRLLSQGIIDVVSGSANEIYVATPLGVFKLPAGGSSWHQASVGLPTPTVLQEFSGPMRWVALLEFIDDPSNAIYVGSDSGGYWISKDGGLSWNWHSTQDLDNNVAQIIVAGDRTVYLRGANTHRWLKPRGFGIPGIVKIDPNGSSRLLKSGLWGTPDLLSLSISDSRKLWLAASSDLLMSDDGGISWRKVDLKPWFQPFELSDSSSIPIIEVSHQSFDTTYLVGDLFQAGAKDHRTVLLATRDGGATWRDIFTPLQVSMRRAQPLGELPSITSVIVDPKDSKIVYVLTDSQVFRSNDEGANWSRLPTGRLPTPFNCLAVSPSAQGGLYLAADHAVFRSTDSGTTWFFSDRGLAGDSIRRLMVSSSIVLAQGNNGIYRMSDDRLSWAVDGWRRMEKGENSVSESVVSSAAAESTARSPSQPAAVSTTTTDKPDRTIDVIDYRIEVQLIPDQHLLRAGADIIFIPLQSTRSVVFELNGALHVESVERKGKTLGGFAHDTVSGEASGSRVRVDLGEIVPARQPVTLRLRWSGMLMTSGGGAQAKSLAHVGAEGFYLPYASRWFPLYDSDLATLDITLIVPGGLQVAGVSDEPVVTQQSPKEGATRYRFVQRKPALTDTIAGGRYIKFSP
jgi:photosystem II stability/assembly factor-like uncharacterized protein